MSIIKKLIRKEIKNTLNELKFDDIAKQFKDQRSSNFYHHQDHLDFMQKEKNKCGLCRSAPSLPDNGYIECGTKNEIARTFKEVFVCYHRR